MKKLGLLIVFILHMSCSSQFVGKINGVSFVASRDEASQEHVEAVLDVFADHAAVMPFGFIRNLSSPEIIFDTDRQWFGETKQGARQYIELLRRNKLKIMLKPQIWIWRGEFTGDLRMATEDDWKILEESYERFILTYAQLAQDTRVEIFCIGTELEEFIKARPQFWTQLVGKIRNIYKGSLTYAANWDEYKRTPFWSLLDYVGIDAYFPLSEEKTPSVEALKAGWQPWKTKIEEIAEQTGKPILFTEFGYRSMDYTAKKPWLVDRTEEAVNLEGQVNAKKAIFEEFWSEDWFAGGFIWKWFIHHDRAGGNQDNRFTPQNKPAEEIIRLFYKAF
ncbi:glycoside hydrolase family 113 [Lentiprolixibacter aurantiacus]|uniref:Glycoside hydrolase TIM-barrel-like domain-containing protein n=1 Tax=Lentiprolixibacter aurantiacus TaxID=2993939 RepID=A0AAE3SM71_9FLAO|nr:glycoside hydrolase TIM-barrel-like domain-containing protein [Lentiprolixibacter aurantiacus]